MEKLELQIVLQMLKKKKEENGKTVQNLKQNLLQKEQEIDVLNKLNTDLQNEYSKIAMREDSRSPLVPPKDHEECEKKCRVLTEKNSVKEKDLEKIQENIEAHRKKWEDREKEFKTWQKNVNEINAEMEKIKESIANFEKNKKEIEGKIEETNKVLNEIEATFHDAEQKFFKAKHDLADIHNVLMEKKRTDLIEEIDQIRSEKHNI
jgi:chromosome segregation protein